MTYGENSLEEDSFLPQAATVGHFSPQSSLIDCFLGEKGEVGIIGSKSILIRRDGKGSVDRQLVEDILIIRHHIGHRAD